MNCKRCGLELEEGLDFCEDCSKDQAKASSENNESRLDSEDELAARLEKVRLENENLLNFEEDFKNRKRAKNKSASKPIAKLFKVIGLLILGLGLAFFVSRFIGSKKALKSGIKSYEDGNYSKAARKIKSYKYIGSDREYYKKINMASRLGEGYKEAVNEGEGPEAFKKLIGGLIELKEKKEEARGDFKKSVADDIIQKFYERLENIYGLEAKTIDEILARDIEDRDKIIKIIYLSSHYSIEAEEFKKLSSMKTKDLDTIIDGYIATEILLNSK